MNSGRFAVKYRATRLRQGQGLYGGNKTTPATYGAETSRRSNDRERAAVKHRNEAHVLNEKEVVGRAQVAIRNGISGEKLISHPCWRRA